MRNAPASCRCLIAVDVVVAIQPSRNFDPQPAGGRIAPDKFRQGGGHGAAAKGYGPAIIDDGTPTPEHARFTWGRFARVLAIGLGMWGLAMGALVARFAAAADGMGQFSA